MERIQNPGSGAEPVAEVAGVAGVDVGAGVWLEGWYKGCMWLCLIMLQLGGGLHGGSRG